MADISNKLAREFQVIIIDVRGHGRREKPLEPEQYGIEMARDVIRLLDHLNIDRANLVGYSMGGLITAKCAMLHPDRVSSFCVGGAGWLRPDQEEAPEFIAQVAKSLDEGNGPLPLLQRLNPGQDPATQAKIKTTNAFLKSVNNSKALAAVFRSLPQLAITQANLTQCKVPGLFIVGTTDPALTSIYLKVLDEDFEAAVSVVPSLGEHEPSQASNHTRKPSKKGPEKAHAGSRGNEKYTQVDSNN